MKEKLIELLGADVCKHDCCNDCEYQGSIDACIAFLKESMVDHLIANGVTVPVHCKDCKYSMLWRKPTDKVIGECFIRKMNSEDEQFCMVGADDFCSWGERRNNEPV